MAGWDWSTESCWRRSRLDPEAPRDLPQADLIALLEHLGDVDPQGWERRWRQRSATDLASDAWARGASADWLWALGLPLLTLAEQLENRGTRHLIGLSALPGCGKSSLGRWLEGAASQLGLSLQVVSIDDFYLDAAGLDLAMQGNPWGVPRALPGSHDLPLLLDRLSAWRQGEQPNLPMFDKALRKGRGDRCGWRPCPARILLLEGWFVGCEPLAAGQPISAGSEHLLPPLSAEELRYRHIVQDQLRTYAPVWSSLDALWQLQALDFTSSRLWKQDQEATMKQTSGVSLDRRELEGFTRMIMAAIPAVSFQLPSADVVFEIDVERRLRRIRIGPDQLSSSSVSRTG